MLTRFHAYKIGNGRLCFSYAAGESFMLVGTHYDQQTRQAIKREMTLMGVSTISMLFIPDWSDVFCSNNLEIRLLLNELEPTYILIPGVKGRSQNASRIYSHIEEYQKTHTFSIAKGLPTEEQRILAPFEGSMQNLLILMPTKTYVPTSIDSMIRACRFDSNGRMAVTDVSNTSICSRYTDIVIMASCNEGVTRLLEESKIAQSAKVIVRNSNTTSNGQTTLLDSLPLIYNTSVNDVVVMSDTSSQASVYYFNSDTKIISNRKYYNT